MLEKYFSHIPLNSNREYDIFIKKCPRGHYQRTNRQSIQVESELTDEHAYYGYPTVTKGPIDVSKVKVII